MGKRKLSERLTCYPLKNTTMASIFSVEPPNTGFQFDNVKRNAFLANKGLITPKTTKTGTTICGAIFDGGVVLGADTRSTSGDIVADKNCMKIHDLAPNMVCCGAGTAADCDKVTKARPSPLRSSPPTPSRTSRPRS